MIGHTRARPVRVAFLVEENENWKEMLHAIFSNCYSRWGGRFNIIVPCKDGRPDPSFIPWLDAYDPDIIYSYVQLDSNMMLGIQERYDPARLEMHQFYRERDRVNIKPNESICGLSSLSTLLGERDEVSRFEFDMGSFLAKEHDMDTPFLDYNFGTYGDCFGDLPDYNSIQWQNIHVIKFENEAHTVNFPRLPSLGIQTDRKNLFIRLYRYNNNRHPSILSAWKSPRAQLQMKNIKRTFLLTVGETFEDYLLFWNTRSHIPQQYDRFLVSLIVSRQDLASEDVRECVKKLLANHNFVKNADNSSNTVSILSISESPEVLREIAEKSCNIQEHSLYEIRTFGNIVDVANSLVPERGTNHDISYDDWGNSRGWQEFSYSGDRFRPPQIEPQYFSGFSTLSSYMYRGVWAQDVDIQKEPSKWKYIHINESWMFPKKLCFVKHLFQSVELRSYSHLYPPRSGYQGRISVFSKLNEQLPTINLMNEEDLMIQAMSNPIVANVDTSVLEAPMRQVAEKAHLSDKGKYLAALLDIAGGHSSAKDIFLHPFWMKCFDELGASRKRSERLRESIAELLNKYQDRIKEKNAKTTIKVVDKILRIVQEHEKSQNRMTHREVVKLYINLVDEYHKQNQTLGPEVEEEIINDSIRHLIEKQILHPGLEWQCKNCLNRNWVSLEDLRVMNTCVVCSSPQTIDIPLECQYVLDGFIRRALRHHGLLACIWCLAYLREIAVSSFAFCCSVDLMGSPMGVGIYSTELRYESKQRELDLLAFVDKKLYLCEVKSAAGRVDAEDWAKFLENTMLIHPDVALMAVMDEESKSLRDGFNAVKETLKYENIEAELYTMTNSKKGPSMRILPTRQGLRAEMYGKSFLE